jgi:hypothetical protein
VAHAHTAAHTQLVRRHFVTLLGTFTELSQLRGDNLELSANLQVSQRHTRRTALLLMMMCGGTSLALGPAACALQAACAAALMMAASYAWCRFCVLCAGAQVNKSLVEHLNANLKAAIDKADDAESEAVQARQQVRLCVAAA